MTFTICFFFVNLCMLFDVDAVAPVLEVLISGMEWTMTAFQPKKEATAVVPHEIASSARLPQCSSSAKAIDEEWTQCAHMRVINAACARWSAAKCEICGLTLGHDADRSFALFAYCCSVCTTNDASNDGARVLPQAQPNAWHVHCVSNSARTNTFACTKCGTVLC